MNDLHGLTRENMLRTFPLALSGDERVMALADITARILNARLEEIERLNFYSKIDELPEDLLDILANDFKVDWWDPQYSIEQKRRTLKDSWNVHRRLGTRWAVETALGNVYPGAVVQEWFEYNGKPYCFRLLVPIVEDGITAEQQGRALSRVWYYKNLRSHLDGVEMEAENDGELHLAAYAEAGLHVEVWPALAEAVTLPDAVVGIGAAAEVGQAVQIMPGLAQRVEATAPVGIASGTQQESITRIWPGVTERVETTTGAGGACMSINQIIEVYPEE